MIYFETFLVAALLVFGIVVAVDQVLAGVGRFRGRRRQRMAESGRVFPVVSRPVLPYEHEGRGIYLVQGVLERTGESSDLRLDAASINDAFRQALEHGVSPTRVTKQRFEAVGA